MLDAVPCNSSADCYAITNASKVLNQSFVLSKTTDGYWQRDSDNLYLVKNINNHYNADKSIAEWAIGYNSILQKYFSERLSGYAYLDAVSYCNNIGWYLPLLEQTTYQDTSYINSDEWSWTNTVSPYTGKHYVWKGTTIYDTNSYTDANPYMNVICVK